MSVFGKLFVVKKRNEPKVSLLTPQTTGEAIQNLRQTEEMLMEKQDFLQKKIVSEMVVARKNAKTNKRMALHALKKKKCWEKYLQQIDGTLTTIEQHREALEGANTNTVNTAVLQTMKSAADALKNAHKGMEVDKLFDEFDEDKLEAELDELEIEGDMEEQEKLKAELLDIGVADQLPETPQEEPASAVAKPAQVPKKEKS